MIQITAQIENALAEMAGRHLPFVASLALNRTAKEARDEVAGNLPKRFRLKRAGIPKTIKVVASKKNNLVAMVTAPGFLGVHETGETVRPTKSSMLAAKAEGVTKRSMRNRDGNYRINMGDGDEAIFKRVGPKGHREMQLVAWLSKEHDFDETLLMEEDVRRVFNERFGANVRDALAQALFSAR